jgi:hypothetical protein
MLTETGLQKVADNPEIGEFPGVNGRLPQGHKLEAESARIDTIDLKRLSRLI